MGLYAAYGSNMDPAQMLRRCPSSPHVGTGWIRGWRLTFAAAELGWEGALAPPVPAPPPAARRGRGARAALGPAEDREAPGVFVALYDLTPADERELDAWEGADRGLYRKLNLRGHTLGGAVAASVYALEGSA